jgi:hypothetical protein
LHKIEIPEKKEDSINIVTWYKPEVALN